MFPLDEFRTRRRLTAAGWRELVRSYRDPLAPTPARGGSPPPRIRPYTEPWQTLDVGPRAKWTLAAGFLTLVIFPTAFPLMFPLGSLIAVVFALNHIHRQNADPPVWLTPAADSSPVPRSPFEEWVREGQSTHRAVETALVGLPKGMRRTFWPLTQQSEDLVQSLQRLALRAQQIEDYLLSDSAVSLRERVERLRSQSEDAQDSVVREHLRQAELSLQSALRDQDEMRVLLERVTAQATHVNAALHHVLAQLVKQRFASVEGAWRDYHSASERLQTLRYQIEAVEQVIASDFKASDEVQE